MKRKFTVIDNDTQTTKIIESEATTVVELKRDLRANGFNTDNKTISEGLTHIEFKTDDAVLPHDVPWNGGITNNLVFRLTKSEKHINSGAIADRKAAFAQVKALGLQAAIAAKYGKNFTQCTTAILIAEIEEAQKSAAEAPVEETPEAEAPKAEATKAGNCAVKQAVVYLTNVLVDNGTITLIEGEKIADILGTKLESANIYTKKQIEDMFKDM